MIRVIAILILLSSFVAGTLTFGKAPSTSSAFDPFHEMQRATRNRVAYDVGPRKVAEPAKEAEPVVQAEPVEEPAEEPKEEIVLAQADAPPAARSSMPPPITGSRQPATSPIRRELSLRQLRDMGLTVEAIRDTLKELQDEGEIEPDMSRAEKSAAILVRLHDKNPQAFSFDSLDRLLSFIERLIGIIERFAGR